MLKKFLAIIVASITVLTVSIFPMHSVFAQEASETITLSPATARPVLNAGEKVTDKLTVINNGTVGYTFLMYTRPFSVSGEGYDPNYTIVNERTEAYQWVQFSRTKVRLEPGERIDIEYTVQTPKSARGGGHYAVLFAETQPPEDQPANVARKKRVGTLLYMRVNGTIEEKGNFESWDIKTLQTKAPVTGSVRLKNSGNIHYEANLSASYTNLFGKKQFELNQQLLVLPGTIRKIPVLWQNPPYFGIFKAGGTVKFLGKTEKLPTKYVLLIPYSMMLAFVGIVAVIIASLFIKNKTTKNKFSSRAKRR